MDNTYNTSNECMNDSSYDDIIPRRSTNMKSDVSISENLANFKKLRISALTKAAEMSPHVKEVTIGPNSPIKKDRIDKLKDIDSVKEDRIEENLFEDKLSEDLRYTLIMKRCGAQFQENSERLFNNLVESMNSNHAKMTDYWEKQTEECQRRAQANKARKLQLLRVLNENDNCNVLEKAKIEEQKCQMVNRQTLENMNRILGEQKKAITDSYAKVCICYKEITKLLSTEQLVRKICDKYVNAINTDIGDITALMDSCNAGLVTEKEVKQAELLALNLDNIRRKILEELTVLKDEEIRKKQIEEEAQRLKELEEKKAAELQAAQLAEEQKVTQQESVKIKRTQPVFHSTINYNYFVDLKNFLDQYEAQYKQLLENPNLKKFRFDCQKAVNTPVNALSSHSGIHIRDKYDKLSKLLKGERVQVLDIYVTATQHPQGLAYCTALLAKKIVRQGDLLVSSNPEAAFPLAAVTVALWSQFPEFGKLLEANFHRTCPYLVPMFLPQKEGQSDKEFYMSRGYTYNDEGVVEKQDKFLKRMSGVFRLRCAIWIAKTPKFLNAPNPHSLQYGWQWLASFINLKPEPDICATLLHDFFIVCGSEFLINYKKQFIKIVKLVATGYLGILQNIDEGGPKTRLEVFLQNVLRTGHIDIPKGVLPLDIW